MEIAKIALKSLRSVPLVGWLVTFVVGLVLVLLMVLSRLQAQRDHHRRLLEAADSRRKLKKIERRAEEVEEGEKRRAREQHEKLEKKLDESHRQIMNLLEVELADEVNRFFESLEPSKKVSVEDLKP